MIDIDLREVAACGIWETLTCGGRGAGLNGFLEDLVAPGTDELKWRGGGVGKGREMKRGFSGIFGRFFARWYLTKHHGFRSFIPIDKSPTHVFRLVIRRKKGQDLPDWIMAGMNGVALGEAKGSHNLSIKNPQQAPPLQAAKKQLSRANIQITSPGANRSTACKLKGWGVMSRWSTEENGQAPLLFVIEPTTDGTPLVGGDTQRLVKGIAQIQTLTLLNALGIPDFNHLLDDPEQFDRSIDSTPDERRIPWETTRIGIRGIKNRGFVGAVIDSGISPVPLAVSAMIRSRRRIPIALRDRLFFVGIDKKFIGSPSVDDGGTLRVLRTDEGAWACVDSGGLVVSPFSLVTEAG